MDDFAVSEVLTQQQLYQQSMSKLMFDPAGLKEPTYQRFTVNLQAVASFYKHLIFSEYLAATGTVCSPKVKFMNT